MRKRGSTMHSFARPSTLPSPGTPAPSRLYTAQGPVQMQRGKDLSDVRG
jgi:hypothetical protein